MAFAGKICVWSGNQWICTNSPIDFCGKPGFVDPYEAADEKQLVQALEAACSESRGRDYRIRLLREVAAIILAAPGQGKALDAKREGIKKVLRLLLLREVKANDDFIVVAM